MMEIPSKYLNNIEGFIFDLDGTIYLGDRALPGAEESIREIRHQHKKVLFLSNKPLYPRENYAQKLTRLGIPTSPEDVITSGYVLGFHLAHTHPELRIYVIGEQNLKNELRNQGMTVIEEFDEQDPMEVINPYGVDAVVVAFDRTFDYRKLNTAYQSLLKGARFFATNPDKACPMPGGSIPDAGATLVALEHLTGRGVELLAGKPSALMASVVLQRLDLPAERCMMVGDRLETDIRMGKEAGMHAAVVLSGVSTRQQASQANPKPDLILDTLGQLHRALRSL